MAETRYFLCRLIPPRPDFPLTMTAEERAIMQNHVAYWTGHLARGTALVFGPVADPKGAWGIGIVAVPDLAAVEALRDADPTILSGRGFRYEILPMPQVVISPK
jgi:uncharacterized protein YciI